MKRYIQHAYLKVSHFVATVWEHPVHNHNHFEVIYIHKGKGMHCVSGMQHAYSTGSLFLLAPCDTHYFDIEDETELTFLKFTNVYLQGSGDLLMQQSWNQNMDQLLARARLQSGAMLTAAADIVRCDELMRMIAAEWKATHSESNETIFFLIQALFAVIRRNVDVALPDVAPKPGEKVTAILHYLHQHIHSPEHTQAEHLAEIFGYSKHYLGVFFKEKTGVGLRDYVNDYRLRLIESRLQYSALSLKEIAYEMGFTDPSHLNKFFKERKGVIPSVYRAAIANKSS